MFFKSVFIVLTLVSGFATCLNCPTNQVYTRSSNEYIFSMLNLNLNVADVFDGPRSASAANTTTAIKTWSIPDMMYYNYFASSMYCPYALTNLTCCYCANFNSTVTSYDIFKNTRFGTVALVTLHPSKNEIVVTFRGSVAIMNWVLDFTLIPDNTNSAIQFHTGFYISLMSVYNPVVQYVGQLLAANPTFRVVINGHSLGGAMASLFTYFLTSLKQFPGTTYALVTFGQPRIGNQGYADYMNALPIKMARVVSRADIVPHLIQVDAAGVGAGAVSPISSSVLPIVPNYYIHHMQEVWINGKTTNYCCLTQYEDFSCSNSLGPTYSILDHLQYFDADITSCYLVEGWLNIDLLSLPVGFTPTANIPPMPTPLKDLLIPAVASGYENLNPLI